MESFICVHASVCTRYQLFHTFVLSRLLILKERHTARVLEMIWRQIPMFQGRCICCAHSMSFIPEIISTKWRCTFFMWKQAQNLHLLKSYYMYIYSSCSFLNTKNMIFIPTVPHVNIMYKGTQNRHIWDQDRWNKLENIF